MYTVTPSERIGVEAGLCSCGRRIVRGEHESGAIVVANVSRVDAAAELHGIAHGQHSYVLTYDPREKRKPWLFLKPRTLRDIKRKPAGFNADSIVLSHVCQLTKETDA